MNNTDLCISCSSASDGSCNATKEEINLVGTNIIKCPRYDKEVMKDKRTFESGATRSISVDKGRFDLLPWTAIQELAIHCAKGAEIHGERNVDKGIPIHSLIDSAVRHLSNYMRGKDEELHLVSALWNIAFAVQTEIEHKECQDIPNRIK